MELEWAPVRISSVPEGAAAWDAIAAHQLVRASDGADLRQRTLVRAAWHGDDLLVRFECEDHDAWGTYTERDEPLWREEAVEIFLAPRGETPRSYAELEVSPLGTLFDAWIDNPDGVRATLRANLSWDCPKIRWSAGRLGREREDWWAEIALPLRALVPAPQPLPELWRANFYRIERPRREGLPEEFGAWSPTLRDPPDFHVPERFGLLRRRDHASSRARA